MSMEEIIPTIDLASTDQLIAELRSRHLSLVVCAFPWPRAREVPQPDLYIFGSYHTVLGMAIDVTQKIQHARMEGKI